MRIGIFDSGLGGLVVLRNMLRNKLKYDFVYLGDTKNLPYGNKSQAQIYKLAVKALRYLFERECLLVIIACNTVSAEALRIIQQKWLPNSKFKDRKVLGVIVPTLETVKGDSVTVLATPATVKTHAYSRELQKINPHAEIFEIPAGDLVQLIESGEKDKLDKAIKNYCTVILSRMTVGSLILGCTHYGLVKDGFRKNLPRRIKIISQEDLLPSKLQDYLKRHKEIDKKLSKNQQVELLITKANIRYPKLARVVKI